MTSPAPKTVIALGMPMARGVHPFTGRCLDAMYAELRKEPHVSIHKFDPVGLQIEHARNMITQEALNFVPDLTHIMWIDDDMTFEPDAVRKLLAHDLPIVGGLCFNRRPCYAPVLVYFTPRGFAFKYDYPEGLLQVDATGAAFLLVKKEVFLKIREKYPEGPFNILGVGEDVSFCKRATAVGYKIFVDTTVKIGHISPDIVIDEEFVRRNQQFRTNPYFEPRPPAVGDPAASVIIPTWNQKPEWLKAAVESALQQTVPVEVIVVDDGSNEPVTMQDLGWVGHVAGIVDSRFDRVRIVRQDHLGCFHALNAGIREMKTDYFTWLSSDDLFYPIKVERQLYAMKSACAPASYHGYDLLIADGFVGQTVITDHGWKTREEQQKVLSKGCAINGLTAMIDKSMLDVLRLPNGDYFDTSFTISADWELWNRIGAQRLWLGLPDVLATRREYPGTTFNASQRYARDPKIVELWKAEDQRIREMYAEKEKEPA